MLQCVIFDCDGTLVDSELLCNVALQIRLRELGIDEPAETMLPRYRGAKLANILHDLERRHGIVFEQGFILRHRILDKTLH